MNGRYILDTNAVIALLKGDMGLVDLLKQATWVGVPLIVELEFLSFGGLAASDIALFEAFKRRVSVLGLDPADVETKLEIIRLRRTFGIKMPDAMIAACAIRQQATLLSNDAMFNRVVGLSVHAF
ncbi:MAG: PIN domain-containing protein [Bacteroidia bacterium]|nr:PIN domain-containing protein [Bacteroidia bacterium]